MLFLGWQALHGRIFCAVFGKDKLDSIPYDEGKGEVNGIVGTPKMVPENDSYVCGTDGPPRRWVSSEVTNIEVATTSVNSLIMVDIG